MADRYTVRTDEGEIEVQSLETLVSLARQGKIGRATMVRTQDSDWGQAELIPQVAAVLSHDMWSAWQAQTTDEEDLLKEFSRPALPDPPRTLAPDPPTVEDLPASAVSALEEEAPPLAAMPRTLAPPAAPYVRRPHGEVIAFPGGDYQATDGVFALDTHPPDSPPRRDTKPKRALTTGGIFYQVNWLRLVLLGMTGLGANGIWIWYVHTTSTTQFTHRPRRSQPAPEIARTQPLAPSAPISPYGSLEEGLRGQIMEGILDISGEEEFEDVLHIELRRVRLDVAWVRVKIQSWAGRNRDLPQDVRFQIRLRGRGDALDRDLGALGLVLGKYLQHYGIDAQEIDVLLEDQEGNVRQVEMDPNAARRFFTHRMSLEEFLQQAF